MAMTVQEGVDGMKGYNNKELIGSSTGTAASNSLPLRTIYIGRRKANADVDHSSVVVDELAIWERALNIEEIGQVYDLF